MFIHVFKALFYALGINTNESPKNHREMIMEPSEAPFILGTAAV